MIEVKGGNGRPFRDAIEVEGTVGAGGVDKRKPADDVVGAVGGCRQPGPDQQARGANGDENDPGTPSAGGCGSLCAP